jgi:predicted ABC-type ATPase
MPQNFAPRKIISTIRKRKHIPDAHLQELERLIKDTDNFKHFTETQKNDLIYLNRKSQRVNRYHSNQKMIGKKTTMKKGGKVVDDNTAMVLSQNKAIAHHTEELGKALNKNERVDAWVVGKMERASTDISDVTHYIDGKTEYADGGNIESKYVVVETDKMGKKRIMGTYYDLTSAEVYAMMKNDFMLKGRSVSIEDGEGKIVKRYEKGGEIEMTPLVGKDGERRIDEKAIDRLEMLARELPQTKYANIDKNGRYIPKRKQLHKKIVDGFIKNKPCITNRQPIAILTGGAPASGKSTFIKKYVDLDPDKVYHIDADEVRAMLPEYKGWNASQTHLETSDIVTKLIDTIGQPCEFDLIYDGTMNRADKYTDLVNKLHNLGYKVFIIYISIPKELSIERSRERYKKSGRYVPKEVIDKVYSTGLVAFEDVAKNMADGYVRIDGVSGDIIEKGGMEMPKNIEYGKGGKIGFEGLSDKVAKNYEGKSVKPEYRKLYGKTYSKEEAKEVGDKVASKVYRQQIAKMEMGGEVGDNALVLSANKMGYIVEVGNDTYTLRFPDGTQSVFRESELQIMNDDEYFADGGDTNKQWVVYVNNDQNIIGTYDSERLAKRMMKEAWNNGDYESVGMGLKSDAYSEEYYAKGGDTSKYNYGRSWHMDKRKFNKSESYELAMNTRKKEMGGDLGKDYEEYEMVVLTKDENGKSHNYRFLVSARNIAEAKEIATDLWNNQFGDMNETLYKVMSDAKYRMDYGMAEGGMMADGGSVNNGTFEVVSVMLNVYDQQGDEQLYEYLQEDQGLDIVSQELKDYRKEKGVANEYFSENGKYYFVVFKKADLRNIIGFEKMMDEFFVPMGMRYTYSEQTKMSMGGYMADGGELKKGDKIVVLGKEFEFVRHEMDSSQGYDEERVILKNEDGIRSYPKDMVEAYSQYKMAKGGQTNTRKYNIIDEGKVVESGVSESKVIDYANTLAFYDLMDESETGDVKEIANFQDALNYLGMVDVEVLEVAGEGSELSKKNLYTFENLGTFADEIEFILDVNDIQFNTKGESIVAVTTSDKMKVVISDIDNLDEPEAKDIVIRTANKVLHGKYVEPTKKLYTSGMSEKTAERILKKLGVVGNAPMNEEQKSKKDERNAMVLFTPAIDKKLFEQYEEFGGDISQQDVVVKIFNPYGSGTWYIINSDPEDPNYLWGIVDLFEVEMGSISRDELVSLRIPPLGVKLERDLSFKPINAQELFTRLRDGENFKFGGNVEYKQKDFDNTIQ